MILNTLSLGPLGGKTPSEEKNNVGKMNRLEKNTVTCLLLIVQPIEKIYFSYDMIVSNSILKLTSNILFFLLKDLRKFEGLRQDSTCQFDEINRCCILYHRE